MVMVHTSAHRAHRAHRADMRRGREQVDGWSEREANQHTLELDFEC